MIFRKNWSFGLGTIFSLIVVYFIYLYSRDKGWTLLASVSKWYMIIAIGLVLFSLGVIFLVILFSLLMFLTAIIRLRMFNKRYKNKKRGDYVDVEYKVKQ